MNQERKNPHADESGPRLNDNQIDAYCLDWVRWCDTRKFYLRPAAQNILARMQPSKSGIEPNIRNNPDLAFFNAAVHSLADMADHAEGYACFKAKYLEVNELIKVQVDKMGISRPTYYSRARSFARKALSLAGSLKRVHAESLSALGEALMVD
ncbi:hypothetical protein [Massilia sp. DWR3-1-1]|uniref:hypothetical protein n=1 Tax=Massilia sp. DWR3-1-1 TaxID=2804559 RepID=UPI003CEAF61F